MQRIAKFKKISLLQFIKDWKNTFDTTNQIAHNIYHNILLPKRATSGSAGYDFYAPDKFKLAPKQTIKIPTGICANIQEGWALLLFPRSSLGFQYRLQMDNTVGVIDSDYSKASNEGHIFIKMTNLNTENKTLIINTGDRFAQGIFMPFGITEDDTVSEVRVGGLGSTK